MLGRLRSGFGFRVAMTLTVLAGLCLVAPPAVMAFGHSGHTAYCVSHADEIDHGGHMASGGMNHADQGKVPVKHDSGCCGLFCVSAIAPQSPAIIELGLAPLALVAPVEQFSFSRAPEQPDRPPISSLSV
jgi:hypothetical protein